MHTQESRKARRAKNFFIVFSLLVSFITTPFAGILTAEAQIGSAPDFNYTFSSSGTLTEAVSQGLSSSPYWWLVSGGKLVIGNGVGKNIQGSLKTRDDFRVKYARAYPIASDNGYHPQNLFRIMTKSLYGDSRQEVYVKINETNLYNSANANAWNGLYLVNNDSDGGNLYYAGIRMDGTAVIKKKVGETHYTLDSEKVFTGVYDIYQNPNLLPEDVPLGLRTDVTHDSNGIATIVFSVDKEGTGVWSEVARATDNGSQGGILPSTGRVGFYSDYMDIEMDNYKIYKHTGIVTPAPIPAPTPAPAPAPAPTPAPEPQPIAGAGYGLRSSAVITETGSMAESTNSSWWVNSGAYFNIANGTGQTTQGNLPQNDPWRVLYGKNNPLDTDNGYHPQNLLRLLTKSTWKNMEQTGYFKISKYNVSDSGNRDAHNGILFFNRYKDGNNLYYTGLRVDGRAIIKKKVNGTYYTLASVPVFSGTYNRSTNPNLLPTNSWIGLRSVVTDTADGKVSIKVYADKAGNGIWQLVAEAIDDGLKYGAVIRDKAYAGIRTDFMDVSLKDYSVVEK